MNAYNKASSFEDNFLGTYAPLILGAAKMGTFLFRKQKMVIKKYDIHW